MADNKQTIGCSSGSFTILGIIFVILKMTKTMPFADWSWIWILSPFWIGFAIAILFIVGIGVFALIALIMAAIAEKTSRW